MKPFFYDVVVKHRPWATDLLKTPVEYLRKRGVRSIVSCEEEPLFTYFLQYLHRSLPPLDRWLHLLHSQDYRAKLLDAVRSDPELATGFQALYTEYCVLVNFELSGRKAFYFDGGLVDKLVATEADAPSELLRLPFPSCFFVIDYPPFLRLCESITNSGEISPETPLSVSLTESQDADGLHITYFVCRPDYRTFRNPFHIKRSWLISPGRKVEDALRTEWLPDIAAPSGNDSDTWFFSSNANLVFFRTLANCILYLSSRTADLVFKNSPLSEEIKRLQGAGKRRRKQAKGMLSFKRSQYSRLDYLHVGGKITVAPFRPFFSGDALEGMRRVLIKRLLVRGHWRNQPYGPQSALRKLIFVEPYWRGPELADEVNKPYEVKL